jgi:hypothetical protein
MDIVVLGVATCRVRSLQPSYYPLGYPMLSFSGCTFDDECRGVLPAVGVLRLHHQLVRRAARVADSPQAVAGPLAQEAHDEGLRQFVGAVDGGVDCLGRRRRF